MKYFLVKGKKLLKCGTNLLDRYEKESLVLGYNEKNLITNIVNILFN